MVVSWAVDTAVPTEMVVSRRCDGLISAQNGLGGALQGRLAVQPAHEDLERQRRAFEVLAQQLQVGAGLLDARDREINRAQRLPDVALQRPWERTGSVFAPPGVPHRLGQLLEPCGGRTGHLALVGIGQQAIQRLVEGANQPPQPDLGAQSTHVRYHSIANKCLDCNCSGSLRVLTPTPSGLFAYVA